MPFSGGFKVHRGLLDSSYDFPNRKTIVQHHLDLQLNYCLFARAKDRDSKRCASFIHHKAVRAETTHLAELDQDLSYLAWGTQEILVLWR